MDERSRASPRMAIGGCTVLVLFLLSLYLLRPGEELGDVALVHKVATAEQGPLSILDARYAVPARVERVESIVDPPRSEAPVDGARERSISLHVTTTEGIPLAGVEVLLPGDCQERIGVSGFDGVAVIATSGVAPEVALRREGFVSRSLSISRPTLEPIPVALSAACVVEGSVLTNEHVKGAMILAWRDGYSPSQAQLRALQAGECVVELHAARCDDQGNFALLGLERDQTYTVTALGQHWISERVAGVVCGEHVELETSVLHGLIVRVRDMDGRPLRTDPRVFGRGPTWTLEGGSDAEALVGPRRETLVARPEMATADVDGRDDKLLLFQGPVPIQRLGPVVFEIEPPGYQPIWSELWAEPVDHELPQYELRTTQRAGGFGDLEVIWVDVPEAPPAPPRKVGSVLLQRDGEATTMGIPVTWPLAPDRFQGLPSGVYVTTFRPAYTYCSPPSGESALILEDERVTRLELSHESCGVVLLEVRLGGSEYHGAAQFRLTEVGGVHSSVPLPRSPFVIPFLRPGAYELEVQIPGRPWVKWDGSMTVLPGELTAWNVEIQGSF